MWWILGSLVFYLSTRIWPYLSTQVPLGYDAGLYLYLFKQYQNVPYLAFTKLPSWVVEMYPPVVPVLGKFLTMFIEPEKLLIPLVVAVSLFLFVAVVAVTRKLWDKQTAQWTGLLLAISALQFRAYWYYYEKQILASGLLLIVLAMFSFASWWAVPLSVLIVLTHRPTALVLGAAIIAGMIFEKEKRRYYVVVAGVVAVCASWYYLPTWEQTVRPLLPLFVKSMIPPQAGGMMYTKSGTFYDFWPAVLLTLPYLPWAIMGFRREWRKRSLAGMTGATVAVGLTIGLGLFLWRRYLIYFDLLAIVWAGAGISAFNEKWRKARWWKVVRIGYVGLLLLLGVFFVVNTGKPLVFDDELREIKMFRETEPDAFVLITDERYTPYIYGWSERQPIAPGYGEYDLYWTTSEWHTFWESNDREKEKELLLKLPKPLYIYHGDRSRLIKPKFDGECFERVNWRTFKFGCG